MKIVILDYRESKVIFLDIPNNIKDIESYLSKHHNFHSDCYYMASENEINIVYK